jgi:uncharacterized membrane protein YjjP (DUF1212 family)
VGPAVQTAVDDADTTPAAEGANGGAFADRCQLVVKLATAAHGYGVSSYRLNSYLTRVTHALGLEGEFLVTPEYINFIFSRAGETRQYFHFVRMRAPSFDMTRLAQVGELVDQIAAGALTLAQGPAALDRIAQQSPRYGLLPVGLGYGLAGAAFAILLSATWRDVFLSGAISLAVYATVLSTGRSRRLAPATELISALVASLFASAIAVVPPGSDAYVVTLCAVVVLIPGLALTLGLGELSVKYLLSGMDRLVDGVLTLVKLFIGAAIGTAVISAVRTVPAGAASPGMPAAWKWVAVVLLVTGLALIFQVRPKDLPWVVLGGLLAYGGITAGAQFGLWQGSFLGALVLGIYAALFARRVHRPASIVMLTDIMVLVPGAAAYHGLHVAEASGLLKGLDAGVQVLINILAIVAGLFVASITVPPKATL